MRISLEKGKHNKFYGSLKSYQNLTKLTNICIETTDVNEGLEYLPFSLAQSTQGGCYSKIECSPHNTNAKCSAIQNELRPFNYDLEAWQLAHPEKMLIARPELFTNPDSKDKWIKVLTDKITHTQQELSTAKTNEADKLSKIARLETTIQELTQAKTQISQQTQTDFQTQNKGTQTDLTAEQITQLEQDSQTFLKLLQATEQELTNTKHQLTQIQEKLTNQNQVLQSQIEVKTGELQQAKVQSNKLSSELETAQEKNKTYLENIKNKEGIINDNNQQIKQLESQLQTSQTELTTQSVTNQELTNTIKQLQSKIKLLEQQKENYQTKYDQSINFIKEISQDIAKSKIS